MREACCGGNRLPTELVVGSEDADELLPISQNDEHLLVDAVYERAGGGEGDVGDNVLGVHGCDLPLAGF